MWTYEWRRSVSAELAALRKSITELTAKVDQLIDMEGVGLMTLADLKAQVDKNSSIEESAVTLITGLAAQLKAAASDPAAVQALADELTKSASDLSAAITANTPGAPAPAK